jgi:transcriptional regulator NrdR family protein
MSLQATPAPAAPGLVCPKCGCRHFAVVYTRPRVGYIMRVRSCRHCGKRVVTRERIGDVLSVRIPAPDSHGLEPLT